MRERDTHRERKREREREREHVGSIRAHAIRGLLLFHVELYLVSSQTHTRVESEPPPHTHTHATTLLLLHSVTHTKAHLAFNEALSYNEIAKIAFDDFLKAHCIDLRPNNVSLSLSHSHNNSHFHTNFQQ